MSEWQPIESAPFDQAVLVYTMFRGDWSNGDKGIYVAKRRVNRRWYAFADGCGGAMDTPPTHWMPLPTPPAVEEPARP